MTRGATIGPSRDRCPGCGRDKSVEAVLCGFCTIKLPWETQTKLCAKGPERLQHVSRLKRALAAGTPLEEIRL
jgi:predicted amidophosphoribosyltransferase